MERGKPIFITNNYSIYWIIGYEKKNNNHFYMLTLVDFIVDIYLCIHNCGTFRNYHNINGQLIQQQYLVRRLLLRILHLLSIFRNNKNLCNGLLQPFNWSSRFDISGKLTKSAEPAQTAPVEQSDLGLHSWQTSPNWKTESPLKQDQFLVWFT